MELTIKNRKTYTSFATVTQINLHKKYNFVCLPQNFVVKASCEYTFWHPVKIGEEPTSDVLLFGGIRTADWKMRDPVKNSKLGQTQDLSPDYRPRLKWWQIASALQSKYL